MKGVRIVERKDPSARTELFPRDADVIGGELAVHGLEGGHVNSTMHAGEGKGAGQRKFRRQERGDKKKSVPTKSSKGQGKKKRGGDEMDGVEDRDSQEAKKSKLAGVEGVEKVSETNDAGLSK